MTASQNTRERVADLLNQYIQDSVNRYRRVDAGTAIVSTTQTQNVRIPLQTNAQSQRRRSIR